MTALLSLLKSIQQHSQQLLQSLRQEKQALDNNQYEQLNQLALQKQATLEQLQELDRQRAAYAADKDFNQYIAESRNPALSRQWETTRQAIRECQQQNEINGRLLSKRAQFNQDILAILSGRNETVTPLYNAQGNPDNHASLLGSIKA